MPEYLKETLMDYNDPMVSRLEYRGDLDSIYKMNLEQLVQFSTMFETMNKAWMNMDRTVAFPTHLEWRTKEPNKFFFENFAPAYKLMEVWVWG